MRTDKRRASSHRRHVNLKESRNDDVPPVFVNRRVQEQERKCVAQAPVVPVRRVSEVSPLPKQVSPLEVVSRG